MSGHYVKFTIDQDGIYGDVECREPEGADCRLHCPHDCEQFSLERDARGPYHLIDNGFDLDATRHDMVPVSHCNVALWLNQDFMYETYAGAHTPARDGAITPQWEGEYFSWVYADPEGSHNKTIDAFAHYYGVTPEAMAKFVETGFLDRAERSQG